MQRMTFGASLNAEQINQNGLLELLRAVTEELNWQEDPVKREDLLIVQRKIREALATNIETIP